MQRLQEWRKYQPKWDFKSPSAGPTATKKKRTAQCGHMQCCYWLTWKRTVNKGHALHNGQQSQLDSIFVNKLPFNQNAQYHEGHTKCYYWPIWDCTVNGHMQHGKQGFLGNFLGFGTIVKFMYSMLHQPTSVKNDFNSNYTNSTALKSPNKTH